MADKNVWQERRFSLQRMERILLESTLNSACSYMCASGFMLDATMMIINL